MTLEPTPDSPTWTRLLKVGATVAAVVLAGAAVVGGASYLGRVVGTAIGPPQGAQAPADVEPGQPVTVEIPFGTSGQDIAAILAAQGVVRSALEFEVAVRSADASARLQAGTYQLRTLMDPAEVVAILVAGPPPDTYRLTIVEGLRVEEMLVALAERTPHNYSDFAEVLLEGGVVTSLREMPEEPELRDWEGLLFPDTYEFRRSATPVSILQRLASTMEQRVDSVDWADWEALGYTKYEGIVLASLIEAEARLDEERPLVSSVIHNRLAQDMNLEIDATVLYALETRDVTRFDRTVDSPYNTYLVAGLPPTPIATPSKASLEAAAHPEETSYLYYVVCDEAEGRHVFAETLDQHNANVARGTTEACP